MNCHLYFASYFCEVFKIAQIVSKYFALLMENFMKALNLSRGFASVALIFLAMGSGLQASAQESTRQSVKAETERALAAGEIQHGPLVDFYSLVESGGKKKEQLAQQNSGKKIDVSQTANQVVQTKLEKTEVDKTSRQVSVAPHTAAK
jgi:hypothetical protein